MQTQIKITRRPASRTLVWPWPKTEGSNCWRGCGNIGTLGSCWHVKCCGAGENSLTGPQKASLSYQWLCIALLEISTRNKASTQKPACECPQRRYSS
jgi:hypothetical protein